MKIKNWKIVTASIKKPITWANMTVEGYSMYGEPEGFFTRDDLIDYIEIPLEDKIMNEPDYGFQSVNPVRLRAYIEGPILEVDCVLDDCEFTISTRVPRKDIDKPSDLENYVDELFEKFDKIYRQYIEE